MLDWWAERRNCSLADNQRYVIGIAVRKEAEIAPTVGIDASTVRTHVHRLRPMVDGMTVGCPQASSTTPAECRWPVEEW